MDTYEPMVVNWDDDEYHLPKREPSRFQMPWRVVNPPHTPNPARIAEIRAELDRYLKEMGVR